MPPDSLGQGYTLSDTPNTDLPKLCPITARELLATEFPPREMILAPWLPEKGLAMIYGSRGIGKTHLTLGVAFAIASGGAFLRWEAPRPRRVLILDGEMPAQTLRTRLAEITAREQREPPSEEYLRLLALDLSERGLDLSDEKHQADLETCLAGAEVIIADSLTYGLACRPY